MASAPNRPGPGSNYYELLGVDPAADAAAVRRAYLAAARKWHPDQLADAADREREEAATRMVAVNEAWRVLGDTRRRASYDKSIRRTPPPPLPSDRTDGSGAGDAPMPSPGMHIVVKSRRAAFVVKAIPWLLGGALVVGLLAVTANGGEERRPPEAFQSRCAHLTADAAETSGFSVEYVACSTAHGARTVRPVAAGAETDCPPGTHRHMEYRTLVCFDGRVLDD